MNQEFICPNCGSTESTAEQYVSMDPPVPKDKNPWSSVLQIITCKQCHREIPAHLGEPPTPPVAGTHAEALSRSQTSQYRYLGTQYGSTATGGPGLPAVQY